jgi:hypothetical protein
MTAIIPPHRLAALKVHLIQFSEPPSFVEGDEPFALRLSAPSGPCYLPKDFTS